MILVLKALLEETLKINLKLFVLQLHKLFYKKDGRAKTREEAMQKFMREGKVILFFGKWMKMVKNVFNLY